MRKKDISKLFKMFSMIDMTKDINKTGTGMGLYISKKLSLKLGPPGDGIICTSELGVGTKFSLVLTNKK